MNDEIKEILAYFEEYVKIIDMHDSEPMLNWKDLKIVLDYITNLQQENEGLKQANKILEENWLHYMKCCEKAIEYIKYNDDSLYTYEPDYDYEENLVDNYEPSNFREDLLNILQNGSDNNE